MDLNVQILTVTQTLFRGTANLIIAPGAEGDFGILPYHASMVILLKKGIIKVHQSNILTEEISITKGWVNIVENSCFFLVE